MKITGEEHTQITHKPRWFVSAGDVLLLQQTLFDAVVTAPMEAYWTALMLNTSG